MRALYILFFLVSVQASAVTLDEAFRSALKRGEVAAKARERVVQAEERVDQAKSAPFPNLSVNANHLIQPAPSNPTARAFFPERQTSAALTLKQPLFRGFREFAVLRQTKDLLSAEEHTRLATLAGLYQEVATVYLQILAYEQDLKNLAELKDISGTRVRDLRVRSRRGESAANEVLTAQSKDAALDAEAKVIEAKMRSARETFRYLTAYPVDAGLADPSLTEPDLALLPLADYEKRVDDRPDVRAMRERVEAAHEQVRYSRGAHWPILDVTGNYYLKRPNELLEEVDWDVQFTASWPLFEGGLRLAETAEAASAQRENELELNRTRRLARSEIHGLHESLILQVNQLKALKLSSELAQKAYQAMQRDYRRGLTRNIDVQLAFTEFGLARRGYDNARFMAKLDQIRLNVAAAIYPKSLVAEQE